MSSADRRRHTPILLDKARNDAVLLRKIADDIDVADEIVGFHTQQTVEKALKAVLEAGRRLPVLPRPRKTLRFAGASGGAPPDRDGALALTPWAAEFRYGDLMASALDRVRAAEVAAAILDWAEGEMP